MKDLKYESAKLAGALDPPAGFQQVSSEAMQPRRR